MRPCKFFDLQKIHNRYKNSIYDDSKCRKFLNYISRIFTEIYTSTWNNQNLMRTFFPMNQKQTKDVIFRPVCRILTFFPSFFQVLDVYRRLA